MMPPDHLSPDDPRAWLNRAKGNLALAKSGIAEAYLEDLCFEAQQAAEKAIKAVMIRRNIEFPYVHDLARLLSLLEAQGESVPLTVQKAEELTRYALITRYPGFARPVSAQEHAEAVAIAAEVIRWAEERI